MKLKIEEPVGILGVGVEGRSTIDYLRRHNIKDITALDKSPIDSLPNDISTIWGSEHDKNLERFAVIFRSPGIRPDHPQLVLAAKTGTQITSATSYFLECCNAPIIAITGTLGKGTACALTAHLLESVGHRVYLGGNIGKNPLDFLDDIINTDKVVLELSSFQTMDLSVSPQIGVILKTTSEHLDWHRDIHEYVRAKSQLFANQTSQDKLIFNSDYKTSCEIAESGNAEKIFVSLTKPVENGIFLEGNRFIWVKNGMMKPLDFSVNDIKLRGKFNLENVAAALAIVISADAFTEQICQSVCSFEGLPHRLQLVAEERGIKFYNDSYATRPDATIGALSAFEETPIAIILGGSEKNADFAELCSILHKNTNIRYIALIGQTSHRLLEELKRLPNSNFEIKIHDNLEDAIDYSTSAMLKEKSGGVVLLSPACASFGLFKNYKVRGEIFIQAVKKKIDQLKNFF